jgi:hypothetical protein
MQLTTEERRQWRRRYVDGFLHDSELSRDVLAESALDCLDEWARQVQLVENQPSANWGNVILQLCRAVESQLTASFRDMSGLACLAADSALGHKVANLKKKKVDDETKQRLRDCGIQPNFVMLTLPDLLSNLASLRRKTGSAHGSAEPRSATQEDGCQARQLCVQILRGIVPTGGFQ